MLGVKTKKKVKDVHHADFIDGSCENGHSQDIRSTWGASRTTFKEKLVGEIPGTYAKAFDFTVFWIWKRIQMRRWMSFVRV